MNQIEKPDCYDLLVIGGGITGAGILRMAAENGMKVIGLEQNDIASATSSKSSKLIHGGLRYLEQGRFLLSYQSLRERQRLTYINSEFIRMMPFYLPIYKNGIFPKWKIRLGLLLYDILAGFRTEIRSRFISRDEIFKLAPEIKKDGLLGGFRYYDAQVDDARLVIENIKSAVAKSAEFFNYAEIQSIQKDKDNYEVIFKHQNLLKKRNCRVIINATGISINKVRDLLKINSNEKVQPSMGIHLVFLKERLKLNSTFTIYSKVDFRPVFMIDWGFYYLVGTTDRLYQQDDLNGIAGLEDIDYLFNTVKDFFPKLDLKKSDIISVYSGIRPLIIEKNQTEIVSKDISREHFIKKDVNNFYTISGGKLTTYRLMAYEILRKINSNISNESSLIIAKSNKVGLPMAIDDELSYCFSITYQFCNFSSEEKKMLCESNESFLKVLVNYAITNEYCLHLCDFMEQRFRLAIWSKNHGLDWIKIIANCFKERINDFNIEDEMNAYQKKVAHFYSIHTKGN